MLFTPIRKRKSQGLTGRSEFFTKQRPKILSDSEAVKRYPHNLTFYLEHPTDSISLKEFEEYAVARLKLLRIIERVNMTSTIKYSDGWKKEIESDLKKAQLREFLIVANGNLANTDDEDLYNCRKYDHISHFILRLAYCRSDELRKWFIAMELDFFRLKFKDMNGSDKETFFQLYSLHFEKVSREEVESKQKELGNASTRIIKQSAVTMDYYKVSFLVVLDLVRQRKVFLKDGMAYVPYTEIIVIIATQFRKALSHSVALMARAIPEIHEDERLSQILTDFDKRYTGKNYSAKANDNSISMEDLPDKSKHSFPLCMKGLYEVVEKDHHLKHFGRLQLGLFLKGIGLPLEEATKFWRFNFTKKAGMDGNRFDKQYLYNIRHMYGKEGKRADYTPYSCMKVIMSSVGPAEHHGCPFRHSDAKPLKSQLVASGITNQGVKEILDLVDGKHYQIACSKYFELTHSNATVEGGIQHPNQFYEESQKSNLGITRKTKVIRGDNVVKIYPDHQSEGDSLSDHQSEGDSMWHFAELGNENIDELLSQCDVPQPGSSIMEEPSPSVISHEENSTIPSPTSHDEHE